MRKFSLILLALAITGLSMIHRVAAQEPAPASQSPKTGIDDSEYWYWFSTCGGPTIVLEVRVDTTLMLRTSFPICKGPRNSNYEQGQSSGSIDFQICPRQDIVWSGYNDTDDTTRAQEPLYGSIWEAGADPDDLILGVRFTTDDHPVMNTLHLAFPIAADTSEIATGLYVITYIEKRQE